MTFAAIFDMDGVLINSHNLNIHAHFETLPKFGVKMSKKDIEKDVHLSLSNKVKKWQEEHKTKIEYHVYAESLRNLQLELYKQLKTKEDLHALLKDLKSNKTKLAVATNSTTDKTKHALSVVKLLPFFDIVITSEDVTKHKPDPEMFLLAAFKLKVKPEHCIVFEDAPEGITAAKKAGMKAIGVLTEYNSKEELRHADLIIKNFNELNYEKLKQLVN